jgi:hypothetical protein
MAVYFDKIPSKFYVNLVQQLGLYYPVVAFFLKLVCKTGVA